MSATIEYFRFKVQNLKEIANLSRIKNRMISISLIKHGQTGILKSQFLNNLGFDIVKKGIDRCQTHISSRFGNFHFQHIDVYNKCYNRKGKLRAENFRFPFKDGYFDFVFLTSVFTHMLPSDLKNYLSQISRVLKQGGRCLITFFILNEESMNLIRAGRSTLDFNYKIEDCLTVDGNNPEAAIAYNEDFVKRQFAEYNLRIIDPIHYGSWCKRDTYLSYQDIVVAKKINTN